MESMKESRAQQPQPDAEYYERGLSTLIEALQEIGIETTADELRKVQNVNS